jgi:hypothetical protein
MPLTIDDAVRCVLCALDYPTSPAPCAHRLHVFQDRAVTFTYHCPVAWARLPEAVFLVDGYMLQIPACPAPGER